jgi:hypothetical protein
MGTDHQEGEGASCLCSPGVLQLRRVDDVAGLEHDFLGLKDKDHFSRDVHVEVDRIGEVHLALIAGPVAGYALSGHPGRHVETHYPGSFDGIVRMALVQCFGDLYCGSMMAKVF